MKSIINENMPFFLDETPGRAQVLALAENAAGRGLDAAEWLIDHCIWHGVDLPALLTSIRARQAKPIRRKSVQVRAHERRTTAINN
jgi:hypothetical protein